jgi:hypothetical protein
MTGNQARPTGRVREIFEAAADSGANHAPRFDAVENWTTRADLRQVLAAWRIGDPIATAGSGRVFDSRGRLLPGRA